MNDENHWLLSEKKFSFVLMMVMMVEEDLIVFEVDRFGYGIDRFVQEPNEFVRKVMVMFDNNSRFHLIVVQFHSIDC